MRRAFILGLLGCSVCAGCYRSHERDGPTSRPDAGPTEPDRDAGPRAPCASTRPETTRFAFDPRAPGCPWGIDDNLGTENLRATARVEEAIEYAPSDLASLCTLRFDFAPDGMPEDIVYDDNFFLLIAGVVVTASDRDLVEHLPREGNIRLWDWTAIRGQRMNVDDPAPYCLGEEERLGTCVLPTTEERGSLRLDVPLERFPALIERLRSGEAVDVTFVTVGDNDSDRDCAHDAFAFEIQASFPR